MSAAEGTAEARRLIRRVRVVDPAREWVRPEGWLLCEGSHLLATGLGEAPAGTGAEALDGGGRFAVPGLIDAHLHIESSLVTPRRFAEGVFPSGTAVAVADPHEIANVAGVDGIRFMLAASRDLPLHCYFSVPSCVPATSPELETAGAVWGAEEVAQVFALDERFLALGEVMDYRAVVAGEGRMAGILAEARRRGWLVEGHCPSSSPADRAAYFAAGIHTDHTLMDPEKIRQELALGVWVELQEKSLTPDNAALWRELAETPGGRAFLQHVLLVTDDFSPAAFAGGHLVSLVRRAIALGVPPLEALAAATVRPARLFGLARHGELVPGAEADFFLTSDLENLPVEEVFWGGRRPEELAGPPPPPSPALGTDSPKPGPAMFPGGFAFRRLDPAALRLPGVSGRHLCRVIRSNGRNTLTALEQQEVEFHDGWPVLDRTGGGQADLALVAVAARRDPVPRPGLGLLAGVGSFSGAVGTTMAHDSHPLLIVGRNPAAMAAAAGRLLELGGGLVAVGPDGRAAAEVPLPVAGLMSDAPAKEVGRQVQDFVNALTKLGFAHQRPLAFLTILALTTSPHAKVSDRGLVDVDERKLLPLVVA